MSKIIDQLARHDDAIDKAKSRLRGIGHARNQAAAAARQAAEALTEAFAHEDADEAALLKAKTAADLKAGEPWAERQAGAQRALDRAIVEREQFIRTNYHALLDAMRPDAEKAVVAIEDAVARLQDACAWYSAVGSQITPLTVIGGDRDRMPDDTQLHQVVRNLVRALPKIVAPLPQAIATIPAWDDPDEERREEARERLRQAAQAEMEQAA